MLLGCKGQKRERKREGERERGLSVNGGKGKVGKDQSAKGKSES